MTERHDDRFDATEHDDAEEHVVDLLVEEVSIDGLCGVY